MANVLGLFGALAFPIMEMLDFDVFREEEWTLEFSQGLKRRELTPSA